MATKRKASAEPPDLEQPPTKSSKASGIEQPSSGEVKKKGATIAYVDGDLLDAKEQYLCHQCNCVTTRAAHLSRDVFSRFPYANIYAKRSETKLRDKPGTIVVCGDGSKDQRLIIDMLGQFYPGASKFSNDAPPKRQEWFKQCLGEIAKLPNLESLAFPFQIGCGAAGGDWKTYLGMLNDFAHGLPTNVRLVIYKLPSLKKFSE